MGAVGVGGCEKIPKNTKHTTTADLTLLGVNTVEPHFKELLLKKGNLF